MKRLIVACCIACLAASVGLAEAVSAGLALEAEGHSSLVTSLVFTADGRKVVSAGHDKLVRIWDVETGKTERTIDGDRGAGEQGKIRALALSPLDAYLAVGGWLGQPKPIFANGVTFDHEKVERVVQLFDFKTGKLVGTLEGSDGRVQALAFGPWNFQTLSSVRMFSGDDLGHICIWSLPMFATSPVEAKCEIRFNKHASAITKIQSTSGRLVASASADKDLRLWDSATGQEVKQLGGQTAFAFSPDGSKFATAGEDRRILLWDGKAGEFRRELTRGDFDVSEMTYTPDGKKLIVVGGSSCRVLSADTGKVLASFDGGRGEALTSLASSGQGTLAAVALRESHAVVLWNVENGTTYRSLAGKGAGVYAVGFAKDGRSVAFGNKSAYVEPNNRGPLQRVVRLMQGDVYSVGLGDQLGDAGQFLRAAMAGGGFKLTPSGPAADAFWVSRNGKEYGLLKTESPYTCYTLTPDGRYAITGTAGGDIEVYRTEERDTTSGNGRKTRDLIGHTDTVHSIAVSPDGRTLVSGSADQTIKLWDIESGQNLLTVFAATDGEWVAWTSVGYFTSSLNGTRYIGWHTGNHRGYSFYSASGSQKEYDRPTVVAEYLRTRGDYASALNLARALPSPASAPAADPFKIIPPVVDILSPEEDEAAATAEFLTVKASAYAPQNTTPVTEIKLLLNGTEVASKKESQRRLSLEAQVHLQPGANILVATARNETASAQVFRTVNYNGRSLDESRPHLRILAIGVSKYKSPELALKFADKDAEAFAALLKKQEGPHLLFNKVETKIILNEEATRDGIIDGLDWLSDPTQVRPNDFLVLFLSGHGGMSRDNYYFYSYNHNPQANPEKGDIRWSTLMDSLTRVRGAKPILFVDTCRAGAAAGGARPKGDRGLTEALKDLKVNYQGVVFFAASSSDEPSLEVDRLGHGVFSYALLKGLEGQADRLKADRVIYIDELGSWVRSQVKELTNSQQNAVYNEPPGLKPFPIAALSR
jgi:WD40 repeat protein